MKKLAVAALMTLSIAISGAFTENAKFLNGGISFGDDTVITIKPEMIPLGEAAFVPAPVASGIKIKNNADVEIDYSNAADGYIMVRSLKKTGEALKAIVKCPGGRSYTYILSKNGNYEVLPLSEGNGSYQVGVYEKVKGTKYSIVSSVTVKAALKDEFAPFLRPNQYVNYTSGSEVIKKADNITGSATGLIAKISAVFQYVTKTITYDKELAATVQSGYITDVDSVMQKGKGICFDYAAVMTAMLRSRQIPTKLVIGYTGNAYHAWINVYSPEKGWIDKAVYFDGVSWQLMDPTFAANKSMKKGSNISYTAKFVY